MLLFGWSLTVPETSVATECRMGFDIGSSGIRVGSNLNSDHTKMAIDYLVDVYADNEINLTVEKTVEAMISLPKTAVIPEGCRAVAGSYSAWRLAWRQGDPNKLIATLKDIHQQTKIALFVIPQDVEAGYGYVSAKVAMGSAMQTPFILDLGGGSLQIADARSGWGTELGQKPGENYYAARSREILIPHAP